MVEMHFLPELEPPILIAMPAAAKVHERMWVWSDDDIRVRVCVVRVLIERVEVLK